jgi:hypothetical protein
VSLSLLKCSSQKLNTIFLFEFLRSTDERIAPRSGEDPGMRRVLLAGLVILSLFAASPAARAGVLRFDGVARIELDEILVHGDPYAIETEIVDIEIKLHGPQKSGSSWVEALGTATIGRDDGTVATIRLYGQMEPPQGSGGFVGATGLGDDNNLYCFRIYDQIDAPTPRPDRLVAAFEPLARLAEGHVDDIVDALTQDPTGGIPLVPLDNCVPLEYRYSPPVSGDFWFTSVL